MWLLGAVPAVLLATLLVAGACAWWLTGRRLRRYASRSGLDAQAALWRHPAGRGRGPGTAPRPGTTPGPEQADAAAAGRPLGPDDDPDFIRALQRMIRGDEPGT